LAAAKHVDGISLIICMENGFTFEKALEFPIPAMSASTATPAILCVPCGETSGLGLARESLA
jgi:hypothetical protein